jgi:lipopolysaccharide export system protein LptA
MRYTLFILALLTVSICTAQTKKIRILKADNTYTDPQFPGATISLGNVFVEHEGATLRCDKAYIYQETKLIKAMGNVVINQGDTINQYSKYSDYDGTKKLATSWGNVVLKDQFMTLRTDTLYFDRNKQEMYYNTGGTIRDTTNFLKSRRGYYWLETKKFQAYDKVVVTNDDSTMESDHMDYYTNSGIAELFGPSTITTTSNSIYTEWGRHNSKTNISHFLKNSIIYFDNQSVAGDSIYYDKNIEFASATGDIKVIDTVNNSLIVGGYAEFFKAKDSAFITNKAIASALIENDSMHIHGDTLLIVGKPEARIMKAFRRVKFFKSDLQGKCDSLISFEKTGLTKLITNPVMWAQGNQITGDTIHLISNPETNQLDSLKIMENAFMIQKDTLEADLDSLKYSQLKGKNMYGKFENNELKTLDVVGNSEVVFYIRNEFQVLIGIMKMQSSRNIFITLLNNEIDTIDFIKMADGNTYPPSEFFKLQEQERLLRGFIWREEERPMKKSDILVHDNVATSSDN